MHLVCDFGTSRLRAAMVGTSHLVNEPCVIARDSFGHTFVGTEAHRMIGRHPEGIELISPVEWGAIRNMDAAVELVRQCIGKLGQRRLARKFELTLAIPGGLTQVETKGLEEVGRSAGARRVHFLNATVAAAMAAGLPVHRPTGCLVVSLGAGVTEASLLSMNGIVSSHVLKTGGQSIEEALVARVKQKHGFVLGMQTAENFKQRLCLNPNLGSFEVSGRSLFNGLPTRLCLDRRLLDEEIGSYAKAVIELIGEAMSGCPPELVGDVVDHGIVLVGGGANIRVLVEQLTSSLQVPVHVADEPDTAVIRGLLQAHQRRRPGKDAKLFRMDRRQVSETKEPQRKFREEPSAEAK